MSDPFAQAGSQPTTISYPPGNTGSHAVIELQKAFYQGNIPREAAIGASTILCDLSTDDAYKLFPENFDHQVKVNTRTVIVAATVGCLVGYTAGQAIANVARQHVPAMNSSSMVALISTIGVFAGAVAAVLITFAYARRTRMA